VTIANLLSRLALALEQAQLPYMLTGSVASSVHGLPRSTRDVDIVIAPTRAQLVRLIQQFPSSSYYADEQQALNAFDHCSQFNVIDFSSSWKVDFIITDDSPHARMAFARRKLMSIEGTSLYVASPEDVLLAKLRWAKLGASDRQLQDAASIVTTQGSNLDRQYVDQWVRELNLETQWEAAQNGSS
jgi:hypothetical protein